MWSDELNKKIQEGESRNLPNYSDKAWEDMESLLDKHLPQKKKRRRLIFLLLPLSLLTGIITYLSLNNRNTPGNVANRNLPQETPQQKVRSDAQPGGPVSEQTNVADNSKPANERAEKTPNVSTGPNENLRNAYLPGKKPNSQKAKKPAANIARSSETDRSTRETIAEDDRLRRSLPASVESPAGEAGNKNAKDVFADKAIATPGSGKDTSVKSPDEPKANVADAKKEDFEKTSKPARSSFAGKLGFQFSFGPDVSMVGFDQPGRVQFQYGVGISYAVSKNITLRTGFFAGDKKYAADSSDYKPPYTIPNLEKIDADCYVYEIPVGLLYHFNPGRKHNLMLGASVSTYIMKKETYGYHYKNSWGQPQFYQRSYTNENKHLFSVITISGGFNYNLSDRFTLMAEPYVKFPVTGIGVGKVKLNNTGVLFSIGYKPFLKK